MDTLTIYTDGSCLGNPGIGGWGATLRCLDKYKELSGSEADTTNNRMELLAVIKALEYLKKPWKVIVVYTDSKYVKDGITQWLPGWKKNGWRTSAKKPVKNQDLWERLDKVASQLNVTWGWVNGHSGDLGNDKADELATKAAKGG